VVVNRLNHPKFLQLLRDNIQSFGIGYGDKELFWISATISGMIHR
jgi:hypothetical protein